MKVESLHSWQVSPAQALGIQRRLAAQVSRSGEVTNPRFIAGVDIAVGKAQGIARGAVVVLSYPELRLVETSVVDGRLEFPYILELSVALFITFFGPCLHMTYSFLSLATN